MIFFFVTSYFTRAMAAMDASLVLDIRACLELRRGWMETMDNGVVIGAFEAL